MRVKTENILAGHNPRRFVDPAELEELTRSIRSIGIIQPISVKNNGNDTYTIVAGHRRYRAALEAGLADVPVHVLSQDEDSEVVALAENTVRADMSAAEECEAAMLLLKRNKGDMTEVALSLGWTESKLRRRVALDSCSQEVRNALAERHIKLGIAELLATVPDKEKQNKALKKIIDADLTVDQVRQLLFKLVQKMNCAIFAKDECTHCAYNTAIQHTLFSEALSDDAYCTNEVCFSAKTQKVVEDQCAELKENYPVVRLLKIGDARNFTKLETTGPEGVGEEQSKKCASCANLGATVSCLVGSEGDVKQGICFDLICNEKMVKAQRAELNAETRKSTEDESMEDDDPENGDAGGCCASEDAEERPQAALSNALKTYRREVWNNVAMRGIIAQPDKGKALIPALISCSKSGNFDGAKIKAVCEKKMDFENGTMGILRVGDLASMIEKGAVTETLLIACAGTAISNMSEDDVQSVLRFLKSDIRDLWTINADYLHVLTKMEIMGVCKEFGLDEKIKGWKKISSGKKDDLIKGIMESGANLGGLVPYHIHY